MSNQYQIIAFIVWFIGFVIVFIAYCLIDRRKPIDARDGAPLVIIFSGLWPAVLALLLFVSPIFGLTYIYEKITGGAA